MKRNPATCLVTGIQFRISAGTGLQLVSDHSVDQIVLRNNTFLLICEEYHYKSTIHILIVTENEATYI